VVVEHLAGVVEGVVAVVTGVGVVVIAMEAATEAMVKADMAGTIITVEVMERTVMMDTEVMVVAVMTVTVEVMETTTVQHRREEQRGVEDLPESSVGLHEVSRDMSPIEANATIRFKWNF